MLNGLGAAIWLSGLSLAKGKALPDSVLWAVGDNHFAIGMSLGLAGLAVLLWTNFRSAA